MVETFFSDVILLPDEEIGVTLLINQNAFIPLLFVYGPLADGFIDTLLGGQSARGLSLSLNYGILTAMVIYDLVQHVITIKQINKWWEKVQCKTKKRVMLNVVLGHLLVPSVLIFFIVMMMVIAGMNAARVTLLYYMFNIFLWLSISMSLSIVEAILKFRQISRQKVIEPAAV